MNKKNRVKLINWIAFFWLGTINNLCYVLINAAAHNIAASYNQENNIGIVAWATVGVGVLARFLNPILIPYISYTLRVYFCAFLIAAGLVALAFAPNFWIALFFIVCVGFAASFGESLFLGYLHQFNSSCLNAWSSGTGMAGILGTVLYVFYQSLGMSNQLCFLVTTPFALFFVLAYFAVRLPSVEVDLDVEEQALLSSTSANVNPKYNVDNDDIDNLTTTNQHTMINNINNNDKSTMVETKIQRFMRCSKSILWPASNLYFTYVLEYIILTGFGNKCVFVISKGGDVVADPAYYHEASTNWFYKNYFPLLSFCFWLGAFLGRSSLQIVKIPRVEMLTLLQFINFIFWLFVGLFKFVPIYFLFPLMFYVGLIAGLSYVNVFNNITYDTEKIMAKDKEFTINICATLITLGITTACIVVVVIDNTFLID